MEAIGYRLPKASEVSGLSRTSLYGYIASGELKSTKIGKCRIIFADSLEALLRRGAQDAQ